MGYPMTWPRVVGRNGVLSYRFATIEFGERVQSDLRRFAEDQQDEAHLRAYAEIAGITPEQAKAVLDALFTGSASRSGFVSDHFVHLMQEHERRVDVIRRGGRDE